MYHINRKLIAIFISSLLLFTLTGCAELDSHSSVNRFLKSENIFRASLRWGEWESVLQSIKPNPDNPSAELKPPSDKQLEYLSTLKVAHVSVLQSGIIEEDKTAESLFQVEFSYGNSSVIKSFRYKVSWWYDNENNRWYTDTPLPEEFDKPKSRTIKLSPR